MKKNRTASQGLTSVASNVLKSMFVILTVISVAFPLLGVRPSLHNQTLRFSGDVNTSMESKALLPPVGLDFWWMSNLKGTPLSLSLETRELVFPPKIQRVWIDVGVHKGSDFIFNLNEPANENLFLIGFEPSTLYKPCTHERCTVFWAACTPTLDIVKLHVHEGNNLCNSVLAANSDTTSRLWRGCVTPVVDKETGEPVVLQVPGLPLHEVVARVPANVAVEYIKIDAQGYDLEVMKGAFPSRDRVEVVSLEAMDVVDKSKLLYVGQPTLNEIKEILLIHGWIFVKEVNNDGVKGEVNAFFVSKEEYRHKVDNLAKVLMSNKERGG